ncbi:DUF4386 domain-containing protein [Maricaulis sp.]|uniref:DUF4386 domain-containing protein n=1 Tax=Maricaulis sp. TaxID=1486257 RepID=UPI002605C890|nr:DUF4386 domain-containing protein [Maricaulis sp.]
MFKPLMPRHPRATARLAGLAYLLIIICAIFAQLAVRGSLIEWSDAGATAAAIRQNTGLLGLGIMADFVVYLLDLFLAYAFYRLFAPVDHGLALLAAWLRIAMTALLMVNLVNFAAPLMLLGDDPIAAQLAGENADQLALVFLGLHNSGFVIGLMMFGTYGLLLGYLVMRSGYIPALIGAGIMISGLSYLAMGVISFALPSLSMLNGALLASAALPEFIFTAWLLVFGLNRKKWEARTGSA